MRLFSLGAASVLLGLPWFSISLTVCNRSWKFWQYQPFLSFLGAETLIPLWWHSLITSFLEFLPGNDGLQHANIAVPHQCALSASSFPQILPAPIPSYIWPKRPLWPVNISAVRVCEIWNSYLESKFKTPVHQPLGSNSAITSSMEASGLTSKQIWLI